MRDANSTVKSQLKNFRILSYSNEDISLIFLGSYIILKGAFLEANECKVSHIFHLEVSVLWVV